MKKYLILVICFFILFLLGIVSPLAKESVLAGKIIVIDPGHGGKDPGTTFGDLYEKDINLKISLYLEENLAKGGAKVILTRNGDYDLAHPKASQRKKSDFDNRIKLINNAKASLYISIHLNYLNDASYHGPQVFYEGKKNEKIAEIFRKALNKETKTSYKIKKIPSETYMYDKLKPKGVLIECGFLSNSHERENLQSEEYQKMLAQAIYNGVVDYFT